ncbi:MAG: ArsR family transcriptional regulator [Desulfurococcaceae archaeon]|uniref:ArsR family transcriptional regulator n=1 Tax=Staphylothermus marinus TaxID=2280 RepID=A0A7C4JLU3_STAMA
MAKIRLSDEEIKYLSAKVRLKILHEDKDVVLMSAPNEDELKEIIRELISEKPMNLREIHIILSGIASEDKIRKALTSLTENGLAIMTKEGRYSAAKL